MTPDEANTLVTKLQIEADHAKNMAKIASRYSASLQRTEDFYNESVADEINRYVNELQKYGFTQS